MDGAALLKKLQIKPGVRLQLLGAPAEIEAALSAVTVPAARDQGCDAALAFCEDPAQVAALAPLAMAGLEPDGPLWFAYRKGAAAKRSGLSRDVGWDPIGAAGYRPVRAIAFDESWSGLRFRETWRVKSGG